MEFSVFNNLVVFVYLSILTFLSTPLPILHFFHHKELKHTTSKEAKGILLNTSQMKRTMEDTMDNTSMSRVKNLFLS